jgi:cytochrome c oxidase assembly protein subunit 15
VLGHRTACATAAATLVLILAGGLVTDTGSGLAVPDWPTTFGHNMFLFPWSAMVGGIFYEHSHRLLGALVGLLTLALGVALWLREPRRWVRILGALGVVLVVVQGVLGGLRVILLQDAIALVHGCLAQAFFALLVLLALVTSRAWAAEPRGPADDRLRGLAAIVVGVLLAQVVLGALVTHAGRIGLHLLGAVAVFTLVPPVGARARRSEARLVAVPGLLLVALLPIQAILGIGAYLARFSPTPIPGGAAGPLALPVAHRLVAALILGAAVSLLAALCRPVSTRSGTPVREPVVAAATAAATGNP